MYIRIFVCFYFLILYVKSQPDADLVSKFPGYPSMSSRIFAGYLPTTNNQSRQLHYVFMESGQANNSKPVVLWLHGGPGCSSKLSLIMQIGPYVLNQADSYTGTLKDNAESWLNDANLLFIDAPAGVGFSTTNNDSFQYNDVTTVEDLYRAILSFFNDNFPKYLDNSFSIAGQQIGSRWAIDLAAKILSNSRDDVASIHLKGVLLGNPLINWKEANENKVEFMINHNLIDPKLIPYWKNSCKSDPESAGCQYFLQRLSQLLDRVNINNVYGQCFKAVSAEPEDSCNNFEGINSWFNSVNGALHQTKKGTACDRIIRNQFSINQVSNLNTIKYIISQGKRVYFYSGDSDAEVPFTDTIKNIERLGVKEIGVQASFATSNVQNGGLYRKYSQGVGFFLIRGAGQSASLYRRASTRYVFNKFLNDPS